MFNHNPKRFVITAVAFAAVAGAALLPGVASADGGPKPRPQAPAIHGTATYGDAGEQTYMRGAKPAGLLASTYGRNGLFGDSNGDADVDASDYLAIKR